MGNTYHKITYEYKTLFERLMMLISKMGSKVSETAIKELVDDFDLKRTISLARFNDIEQKFLNRNLSLLILKINNYLLLNVIEPEKMAYQNNPPLEAYDDSTYVNKFRKELKDPLLLF